MDSKPAPNKEPVPLYSLPFLATYTKGALLRHHFNLVLFLGQVSQPIPPPQLMAHKRRDRSVEARPCFSGGISPSTGLLVVNWFLIRIIIKGGEEVTSSRWGALHGWCQ